MFGKNKKAKVKKPFYRRWWFVGMAIILGVAMISNGNENSSQDNLDEPVRIVSGEVKSSEEIVVTNDDELVGYNVVSIENLSFSGAKRYVYNVVVNEEATVGQLRSVAQAITQQAKENIEFNAISIAFYDHKEYIGYGYTLGSVTYAPYGNWGDANTVKTGKYDTMQFNYTLTEKDWSKQLTQEEVNVFVAWKKLYHEYEESLTGLEMVDEEKIDSPFSQHLSFTFPLQKKLV